MSIASSSYKPKSFEQSSDLEDLRQQLKLLVDQNKVLTSQLQELIEVNNELTSSIEQYSKLHEQKFGPIDQSQLQELAQQVNQLQQELLQQRLKSSQMMKSNRLSDGQSRKRLSHSRISSKQPHQKDHFNIDEIYEVIRQLSTNVSELQQEFHQQLQILEVQFNKQKQQSQQIIAEMEQKWVKLEQLAKQLVQELYSRDQIINNLNREISNHRNKKSSIQKQMKISLTIEDLKITLEKKIQEKEQIIKCYQSLLADLKSMVQNTD